MGVSSSRPDAPPTTSRVRVLLVLGLLVTLGTSSPETPRIEARAEFTLPSNGQIDLALLISQDVLTESSARQSVQLSFQTDTPFPSGGSIRLVPLNGEHETVSLDFGDGRCHDGCAGSSASSMSQGDAGTVDDTPYNWSSHSVAFYLDFCELDEACRIEYTLEGDDNASVPSDVGVKIYVVIDAAVHPGGCGEAPQPGEFGPDASVKFETRE